MTWSIAVVLALVVIAVYVFATERLPIETFSLLVLICLIVSRILTPQQAFLGFANSAVVMIAGVMVLTGGVIHHGAAEIISRYIERLAGRSERRTAALLLAAVNAISSVINNVAATAMFIPVAEAMARQFRVNRGKYLMPIAFASMTGGMCTLIGTSTNVAVAGAMEQLGLRPLGFFELTPVGVVVAVAGLAYLLWVAPRILKLPPEQGAVETFGLREFLYEIVVPVDSPVAGRTISQIDPGRRFGLNVLAIVRGLDRIVSPGGEEPILGGDLLLVEGQARTIPAVRATKGMEIKSLPSDEDELTSATAKMIEATVSYNSPFIGKTLKEIDFRRRFGLSVLAIHRREEVVVEKVGHIRLRAGDVLLVYGREELFPRLGEEPMLLVESIVLPRYHPGKAAVATAIFAGAIVTSAMDWMDAPSAFLAGGTLMIVFKVLSSNEAAAYVNLRFLIMIAAMASLASAMEISGAAEYLAHGIVAVLGTREPLSLAALFFLLTVVLTQPLSNAAAALLVLPIAVRAAGAIGADPRAFAIGVTIAASCSFVTPFEPACLLVYSTGNYRFGDFVKVGVPLTLVAFVIAMLMVPVLWPFRP